MNRQTTNEILMVRPAAFHFNAQTANSNRFQIESQSLSDEEVASKALAEFDGLAKQLERAGVRVNVLQDTWSLAATCARGENGLGQGVLGENGQNSPNSLSQNSLSQNSPNSLNQAPAKPPVPYFQDPTPDSIFPNNWFVTLGNSRLFLSSMQADNRHLERLKFLPSLLELLGQPKAGANASAASAAQPLELLDFACYRPQGRFLEGTGVLILDRVRKIAYACLSPRCDALLVSRFCDAYGYRAHTFCAQFKGAAIYHSNVMMAIGSHFAHICLEAVDEQDRAPLREKLAQSHEINELSLAQIELFAGNVLELQNAQGQPLLAMSTSAWQSFSPDQKRKLESRHELVIASIPTIQSYGGGGVRCMIAEIFG